MGGLDLTIASAVLYVLLPDISGLNFLSFLGVYLIAMVAGIISSVPGGMGVFESILILLLPTIPASELLGAMVVYRCIYYILPLIGALILIVWRETSSKNKQKLKKTISKGVDC